MKCRNAKELLEGFPFEIQDVFFRDQYDNKDVYVHRCMTCNCLYVGIGIQAYDSNYSYWAVATNSEIEKLEKFKNTPEIFAKAKRFIEEKPFHIFGDRDGKYYYKQESAVVLPDSAPW